MADTQIPIVVTVIDNASGALNQISTGALRSLGDAAVNIAGQAVQAMAGFGASSLQVAADFEKATSTFASVAGGALKDAGFTLDDVKNKALELGAQTQFSAAQAQEAMINLAKGGVPVADIMGKATDATLALAAAGDVELAPAADIVAKQLGVWADTGVQAADVANLMAQAANASTVDVQELALGLSAVGGVAKVSGVSFQDLTQTMALLAPGFSSASDAGTSFKTMLLALQGKSSDAVGVMKQLNIISTDWASVAGDLGIAFDGSAASLAKVKDAAMQQVAVQSKAAIGTKDWQKAWDAFLGDFQTNAFYDQSGQMKSMDQVAQILQNSLAGLSEEQKTAALNTMFGTDAYRAAAFIAQAGAAGFHQMADSMTAAGSAAEQAAVRNQNFKFAWDSLLGTIETIQIVIGSALLPILTQLTNDVIIPAANGVLTFAQSILSASDPMATLTASINSAVPGFDSFVTSITQIISQAAAFLSTGNNLEAVLAGIGVAIAVGVLPPLVAAAASFLALVAPIVALIAVGALLYSAWTNNFLGIQEIIGSIVGVVTSIISPIISTFTAIASFVSANLMPILAGVGTVVAGLLIPALASIAAYIAFAAPIIAGLFAGWVVGAVSAAAATLAAAAPLLLIGAAVALLFAAWQNNWFGIRDIVAAVWAYLQPIFAQIGVFFTSTLPAAFFSAVAAVQQFAAQVQAGWGVLVAGVMQFVASVQAGWGVVVAGISSFISSVQAGWGVVIAGASAAWAAVVAVVQGAIAGLVGIWNQITAGAAAAWAGVVGAVMPYVNALVSGIQTGLMVIDTINRAVWNTFAFVVGAAWQGIMGYVQPVLDQIVAGVQATVAFVTTAWSNITAGIAAAFGAILTIVSPILASVGAQIQATVAAVQAGLAALGALVASAVAAVASAIASVAASASSAWAGVVSAASSAWSSVASTVSSAWASITASVSSGAASTQSAASSAWAGISAEASSAWAGVQSVVSSAIAAIVSVVQSEVGIILSVWSATMAGIEGPAREAWANVQSVIQSAIGIITTVIQVGVSLVQTVMSGAWRVIVAAANNDFGSIPGIISGVWEKIKGTFSAGIEAIRGYATAFTAAALTIGRNIIDGIIGGVKGGIGALKDAVKSAAESALNAAKSFLGIHSPSTVMAVRIGQPIVEGIALGITTATPKLTEKMLDLASKVIDIVDRGVGAFGKIGQLGRVPTNGIKVFADSIMAALQTFGTIVDHWNKAAMSAASQFTRKAGDVVDMLTKGVDFLLKLGQLGTIPRQQIGIFVASIREVMTLLVAASTRDLRIALSAAVEFALSAGKILEAIGKGVEGLNALSSFVAPTHDAFVQFRIAVQTAVGSMAYTAQLMATTPVSSAVAFATSAGTILDVIGKGVESLEKLAAFDAPLHQSFVDFRLAVQTAVGSMAYAAAQMANVPIAAAVQFASSAGQILDIVGKGVDALTKLVDFTAPAHEAFAQFRIAISTLVGSIAYTASQFQTTALAAAANFAEAAGKVIAIVGSGVDALNKLASVAMPDQKAYLDFYYGVVELINIIDSMRGQYVDVGLDASAEFAETAGKIVALTGAGVEALNKLTTAVMPDQAAYLDFYNGVVELINIIDSMRGQYVDVGLAASAEFAETAGKIVSIVKGGVEGLNALAELGPVAFGAIQSFASLLGQLVTAIAQASAAFSADALAASASFAETGGKVVGVLKSGVDGFAALADLKPIAEGSISLFVDLLNQIVVQIAAAASAFDVKALEAAAKFADAGGKVVGILAKGVEGFHAVDAFSGVTAAALARFGDGLRLAVQTMIRLAAEFTADALGAAVQFGNAAQQCVDFLDKGVKGFNRLGELTVDPGTNLDTFAIGVKNLVITFVQLAAVISAQMLQEANRIAIGLDAIISVLNASLKSFRDIADITRSPLGEVAANYQKLVLDLYNGLKSTVIPTVQNFGPEIVAAIAKGLSGTGGIATALQGMVAQVAQALASVAGQVAAPATNIGQNIAIGMANGIRAGTPAIQNAVYAAVNAALAAARAALGIASPSKVFATIGRQTGEGQVQGMDAMRPAIAQAGQRMAQASIPAIPNPFAGIQPVNVAAPRAPLPSPSTTTTNRSTTIQIAPVIHTQPGQSTDEIADLVAARIYRDIDDRLAHY